MPLRHPRRFDSRPPSFPQPPVAPRVYRNIALTFLGLTTIVVGVAAWMFLVRAEVRVHVKPDTATIETFVDIAKSPEQGQLQGRVVEGTFDTIREFAVKERENEPAPVATTTGRVRITNRYSKAQPLIRTTRLLASDGKLFRINATVNVPPGGSVEVDAYSDEPGSAYLIKSGATLTIPGLWIDLQKLITAEVISDFTGQPSSRKAVTAADIGEAYTSLEEAVIEQAKKTLAAEALVSPEMLAADCGTAAPCWSGIYLVTPLEKKSNVTAGQETDTFLAQVKAKVTAVFYPKMDMEALVRTKLKERLPEGRDLVDFDASRVIYRLEQTDASAERARIQISARASSRLTSQSPALSKAAVAGMSVDDVRRDLSRVEGVEFVEITLRPSWARRLPNQKDRIELLIE